MTTNCLKIPVTYFCENMNNNKNDLDITKWTKASYFHCGLSTKNQKHQRQKEKHKKIYSNYQKYT